MSGAGPADDLDRAQAEGDDDLARAQAEGDDATRAPVRRARVAAVVTGALGVVLLLFIVLLATREPATDRQADSPLLGKTAPRIEGTTIEGRPFDSAAYDGRWLVVNFFATWCAPCVEEHPELTAFQRAQAEAGQANVISVVFSDDEASVKRFFARQGGDWPVVLSESTVVTDWGVSGVPESFLVDPGGTVRVKLVGGVTAAGLDQLLAEASGMEGGG